MRRQGGWLPNPAEAQELKLVFHSGSELPLRYKTLTHAFCILQVSPNCDGATHSEEIFLCATAGSLILHVKDKWVVILNHTYPTQKQFLELFLFYLYLKYYNTDSMLHSIQEYSFYDSSNSLDNFASVLL